jgi:NitT/TauT family transport system substrate-binding protein
MSVRRSGWLVAVAAGCVLATEAAAEDAVLKLGVLKFGTVQWELDVVKHHGLDAREGFTLDIRGYGGGEASNVALMAGEVDCIVDDYLWVARMRADGADLVYAFPYSSTVGALVVHAGSEIDSLDDLSGRRVGVAGGPYDKSWLLVRAVARKRHGIDLADAAELAFGAPPLLNEKFASGELDAVLNYWHYVARLEAAGHRRLLEVADAQAELGVARDVPQLGYVCRGEAVAEKPEVVRAFAAASRAAKDILAEDDAEWQRIRPLVKAEDDTVFETLVRRYREGIVRHWGNAEREQAEKLFAILAQLGGEKLVGAATTLPEGTFWDGVRY